MASASRGISSGGDVSSIPEDETDLVGAVLAACWGVGFGAVNVTHALAEAGLAPMRHYMIILDELWRTLIAGRGMVDRTNSLTRLNRQWGVGVVMCSHTIKDLLSLPDEHERMNAIGLIERSGMLICGAREPPPPADHCGGRFPPASRETAGDDPALEVDVTTRAGDIGLRRAVYPPGRAAGLVRFHRPLDPFPPMVAPVLT